MTPSLGLRWPMLATIAMSFPGLVLAKMKQLPCAKDPFVDPKTDPCNALEYIASNVLTGIAFGLYLAVGLCHAFSTWKWGAKWQVMSAMTIGIFTFALGVGCRFGLHIHPQSKGIYIVEYLLVVLSRIEPCAFIAADYVLLGRMAIHMNAADYLMVSPRRVTPVFITSDVTTFLIQAAGGSVSIAANDVKTNRLGSHVRNFFRDASTKADILPRSTNKIFLAGLVIQLVSFFLFTCMYLRFLQRIYFYHPEIWQRDSRAHWSNDWRILALALFISCIGILVRSVFRVIELSQGFKGPLATNEGAFYGLDTLPLFVAITIYVPFWPGRFISTPAIKTQLSGIEDKGGEEKLSADSS